MSGLRTPGFHILPHLTPGQIYRRVRTHLLWRNRISAFNDAHPCVFVLSTGRAGTQTLASLFQLSKNVKAYHEPAPKLYGLSKLSYWYIINNEVAQEILSESFLATRSEVLRRSLEQGKGYVETSPQTTFLAHIIAKTLPAAKFIHLVRDPREVVRSGMRRKWYDGHRLDRSRITPAPNSTLYKRWSRYSPFQKNLWLWNETNQWIADFLTAVPPRSKLLIHAEDIFNASPDVLQQLFDFINAPLPSERKIKRILKKRLNAQRRGDFPKSEQWDGDSTKELIQVCGDTANQFGYTIR